MVRGCDNCDQIAHLIKKRRFLTKKLTLRKPLGIKITIDYWQKKMGKCSISDARDGGICGTFRDENQI